MQGLAGAEQALSGALGRLFALAEAYPDLKANQNMAQLTEELTSTENRSPSPGRPTTTRSPPTTPIVRPSRRSCSPTCFGQQPMRSCWNSTAQAIAEAPKVSF